MGGDWQTKRRKMIRKNIVTGDREKQEDKKRADTDVRRRGRRTGYIKKSNFDHPSRKRVRGHERRKKITMESRK